MNLKRLKRLLLASLIGVLRPLFGHWDVCIYHSTVPCIDYALCTIENRPLLIALPLIMWRVLSCNPLTAIYTMRKNTLRQ